MPETRAWIPMTDGVRLAATLFLPDGPGPRPAVLEALPYRKDDQTQSYWPEYRRLRDEGEYAVARVDLRGTGSSEGLAVDEYPEQEQRDLVEVVAWLAEREWCTGAVGMYGASYSGFNALQVAMERPPALKAIIAIYATDDRYHDDVSYWGGARRGLDFVDYPTYMVAMNALPPVPAIAGEGWREAWRERVERLEPWMLRWLEEEVDGPYWRHGSLRPEYDRIACPVMLIGGWADGYRNATLRVMEALRVPCRLLMGPWSHRAAEASLPGPRIDWVPDMLRWWDRWLKAEDNGVDREPSISLFVRRSTKPEPDLDTMRGEWRYERGWPLERVGERELALRDASGQAQSGILEVRGDVGVFGAISCAGHLPYGQPLDQRPDEAHSLMYDWPVGGGELEILGYPRLQVTVRSSAPVAFLSAKLCDVFPDGTSALVSRGFLNLTHRHSHTDPEQLSPGQSYSVTLELDATSWVFEAGHRVRLDLAGADWPNVWPPPGPVELAVEAGESRLILPVAAGHGPGEENSQNETHFESSPRPTFASPREEQSDGPPADPIDLETRAGVRGSGGTAPRPIWLVEQDLLERRTTVFIEHGSDTLLEDGSISVERYEGQTVVSTTDPGKASARGRASFTLTWPEATVGAEVRTLLESDETTWHVTIELDVSEGDLVLWQRRWDRLFPRHLA